MPRLKGFWLPREILVYAVWAYYHFAMSTADVEDLLVERVVIVSREAIRLWDKQFGPHFADCIRRDRLRPNNKWNLDEVVFPIRGKKHWVWRTIHADRDVPDILAQTLRNAEQRRGFTKGFPQNIMCTHNCPELTHLPSYCSLST